VLRYADAMTRDVIVSDVVFEALKEVGFCEREIVELTVVIAGYNCVSRFLVALDVGEMSQGR
jgi:alkylhydroperoxidase family enzyme